MKRFALVSFLALLSGFLAFAEGTPRGGDIGIQGSLVFPSLVFSSTGNSPAFPMGSLGAKYFITEAIAVRAGIGLDNVAPGGASTTGYDLAGGFEYHFGGKGGVSPYAGAQLSYSGSSLSGGGSTASDFGLRAVFGGEYFFSNNFSWAGELGLGFDSAKAAGGANTTSIGTAAFSTALTWYLN